MSDLTGSVDGCGPLHNAARRADAASTRVCNLNDCTPVMILIALYRNTEHPERAIPAMQALVAGGAAGTRGPHVNREHERDQRAARRARCTRCVLMTCQLEMPGAQQRGNSIDLFAWEWDVVQEQQRAPGGAHV